MKKRKKIWAIVCAVILALSGIVYAPEGNVSAASYDSLTYTSLGTGIAYSYVSNTLTGLGNPELLDAGQTMQFAFSADNKEIAVTIDGADAASHPAIITIGAAIVKLNPTKLSDNAYTYLVISSSTGKAEVVIKRGNPAGGGQVPSSGSSTDPQPSSPGGEVNPPQTTAGIPDASSLPKKAVGLNPQVKTDTATLDNSVLLAWASAMAQGTPDYDASVYTYNAYVYKNGNRVSKVCNVTNGCILGGLSAGTYSFSVAAVNAMGEGPESDKQTVTITGYSLDYTPKAEYNGPKIPDGFSITSADATFQANVPQEEQKNKLWLAWAASNASPEAPGYDTTVTGYNVYVFNAETGKPYRRVHVDGIGSNTAILESVSAGKYVAFVTAENASGESGMAAPGLTLPSSVEIKGETYDNAQDFDYPDQPGLPLGLVISGADDGVGNGFTVAWSREADLAGVQINVFVDGVCVKAGANNGPDPSYHETRLKPGTYEVSVTMQYISNQVESVPFTKTITVTGEGTNTPEEMADATYSKYEKPGPVEPPTSDIDVPTIPDQGGDDNKPDAPTTPNPGGDTDIPTTQNSGDNTDVPATQKPGDTPNNVTTQPSNTPGTTTVNSEDKTSGVNVSVGKVTVKKATKKIKSNKSKISLKKVKGATGYKIQISTSKKFKKVLMTKNVKKASVTLKNKKLKNKKKLYARAKAYKVVAGKTYEGKWSKAKKIKIKK